MKTIGKSFVYIALIFILAGAPGLQRAHGTTQSGVVDAAPPMEILQSIITQEEISRGLDFCREHPLTVSLQGQQVTTPEKDVPPVIIGSRTLIPARAFFETMGAKVTWQDATRTVIIQSENITVELTIDSVSTRVNGKEQLLDVPAMIIDHDGDGFGSTMLPLRFVSEGLGYQVSWAEETRTVTVAKEDLAYEGEDAPTFDTALGSLNMLNTNAREKLVIIDIGHGGNDTGAIAKEDEPGEVYEKDINLKVGLKLKELLEQAGFRYMFTREADFGIPLLQRPAFANENQGDIFVSIHNNSSDKATPKGTEVYYYSKLTEEGIGEMERYGIASKDIAGYVQKEMVRILGTDNRGAKEGPKLAVLNKTSMPAIIVEGAFLSNSEDYERIVAEDYADKYAYALVKGLIKSMNEAF